MLRSTMGTPQTPVGESATEEVLEDADSIVDADEDEAFDSRETNALPRVDAAPLLPDATEKVSAESILGVASALLAEADVPTVPPPQRRALPSSPTPFSVALPIRIETGPLAATGRVETLPEPAELDAWVPPTLPPRAQAIDPTAQVAAMPLRPYWPLFAAAAVVGLLLVGAFSLGMRQHATSTSAMRADGIALRTERTSPAASEAAGPPRPALLAKAAPRPAPKVVVAAVRAAPGAKNAVKAPPKKPAPKAAPKAPPAQARHK